MLYSQPFFLNYSLNKTVPSNALFTDTNTWRGIQNNLTSTSTTDSLSAYQGKLLNDKITEKGGYSLIGSKADISLNSTHTITVTNIAGYNQLQARAHFINSSTGAPVDPSHFHYSDIVPVSDFKNITNHIRVSFFDPGGAGFCISITYNSDTSVTIKRVSFNRSNTGWDGIKMNLSIYGIK